MIYTWLQIHWPTIAAHIGDKWSMVTPLAQLLKTAEPWMFDDTKRASFMVYSD
jgi:hypothetical protein